VADLYWSSDSGACTCLARWRHLGGNFRFVRWPGVCGGMFLCRLTLGNRPTDRARGGQNQMAKSELSGEKPPDVVEVSLYDSSSLEGTSCRAIMSPALVSGASAKSLGPVTFLLEP
jgi:hypothetical protein